ncbi:MAG: glycosyltransferase family 4 protein [Chloroflexota bacterium]|jgi:glycosyltransferase involved in cell wall biosynthesis
MTKPLVAILHYTCPPIVGGVEQLIAVHAGLLADRGYPTRIITGKGEPFRSDVPVDIVPSLYSKDPELLAINEELDRGVVSDRFYAMAEGIYRSLSAALAGVGLCVVHNAFTLHFNLPLTAALVRMVERGEAPRIVAWCHDVSWKNDLYIPKMRDSYPWTLLKESLAGVSYVAVSELRRGELADLMRVQPERFTVIPAGVDPAAQLKLEPETVELVRKLSLMDGDLLMLAPVRITKRKNLEMSIRITHALLQLGVNARLLVTGPPGPHNIRSGDYVEELRSLRSDLDVEREVILLFEHTSTAEAYPVTDRMMYDLYSLSDLLLFSSAQEGFGIPLIEAGLLKLPVFCSNIPPFREIGLDGVNYFELSDRPETVASRIRDWMGADRTFRFRKRVLAQYWWDSVFSGRIEPLLEGRVK